MRSFLTNEQHHDKKLGKPVTYGTTNIVKVSIKEENDMGKDKVLALV